MGILRGRSRSSPRQETTAPTNSKPIKPLVGSPQASLANQLMYIHTRALVDPEIRFQESRPNRNW